MTFVFTASSLAIAAFAKGGRADYLAAGLTGYVIGGWIFSLVLKREFVGAIGPVTTVAGMVLTVIASRILFAEPAYTPMQWIGFAFSSGGVALISLGKAAAAD